MREKSRNLGNAIQKWEEIQITERNPGKLTDSKEIRVNSKTKLIREFQRIRNNPREFRRIRKNPRESEKIQGNPKESGRIRGNARESEEIQQNPEESKIFRENLTESD